MTTAMGVSNGAPLSAFRTLLGEFLVAAGHPELDARETTSVEFTSEDLVVQVYPHPTNDEEVVVDIQIFELGYGEPEEDAQRFLILHRLNETSRFSTGWMAMISADDMLLLTCSQRISETDGKQLAALVADGLDRATTFAQGWISLREFLEDSSSPEAPAADAPLFRV